MVLNQVIVDQIVGELLGVFGKLVAIVGKPPQPGRSAERLVTGDLSHGAARLQQEAAAGEEVEKWP